MTTPLTPKGTNAHPMMIIAALAVVLFCLAGTAAIMGWIPSSIGGNASNRELTESDRALLASQLAAAPPAAPAAPAARLAAETGARDVDSAPAAREAETAPAPRRQAERPVKVARAEPASNWCSNCGNVESVRAIKTRAEGSGLGAAGGAVLGGLLGHQVGGGSGQKIATVAGAVGGAVVGNQVEGNMKATTSYEIKVRLDDGSARTFRQASAPRWGAGDRVKIVNGALRSAA